MVAPFGYEITIRKSERENTVAIQQQLIDQIESWRVDGASAKAE